MFFARDPIRFPPDLESALQAALNANLRAPEARRAEALRALWPKLARERGRAAEGEQHYSFRREEAEAYAAYYLPANCLKPALILEEAFLLGLEGVPAAADWLDLGTGPGTAFWGLAWWFRQRGGQLRFTGWDQSPQFREIARSLAGGSQTASSFLTDDNPLSLVRARKPTHVSFVNSIAEIHPDPAVRLAETAKLLRALGELERKDGRRRHLLIVEPGSRDSSRELAALKDALQRDGHGHVLLPCLDDRACGALKDPKDWCHEEVGCEFPDWLNAYGASAGLRKEALLFSYAWIRPGKAEPGALRGCGRVVSQRMERKGQVECRLCLPEGKKPARVQRSKATPANEFALETVRGELWRGTVLGEKGDVEQAERVTAGESVFRP